MALMGQGLILMIAGMAIVYVFLYLLIVVSEQASRFVSRFDALMPDESPTRRKPLVRTASAPSQNAATRQDGTPVKAPVPGCVLRLLVQNGQTVSENDDILVMDVMKMETPLKAPCSGVVTILVAPADKVSTGSTIAFIA